MISITKQHPILIALSNYVICYLQQRSQSHSLRTIIPILQMKNIEVSRDEVINQDHKLAEPRLEVKSFWSTIFPGWSIFLLSYCF